MDNEKGISYFKFISLDYGYSGDYLNACLHVGMYSYYKHYKYVQSYFCV